MEHYITENKEGISSFQIEHLKPHRGYEPILDCTQVDVDRKISDFKNLVRDYEEAEDYDKEDIRCRICREVGQGAAFAAFKRWVLWDDQEKYKELLQYCGL